MQLEARYSGKTRRDGALMEKFEQLEKSKIENQIPVEPPATQRNFLACLFGLVG